MCERVRERESVCVRAGTFRTRSLCSILREHEKVRERGSVCVSVCERGRPNERERERERRVCVREREREKEGGRERE